MIKYLIWILLLLGFTFSLNNKEKPAEGQIEKSQKNSLDTSHFVVDSKNSDEDDIESPFEFFTNRKKEIYDDIESPFEIFTKMDTTTNKENNLENPFDILKKTEKEKETISIIDSDDDPFNLFNLSIYKKISEKEIQENLASYSNLIKIIWNIMISDKQLKHSLDSNESPTNMDVYVNFTGEILQVMRNYMASNEENISSIINNYLLDNLKIENENIIQNEQSTAFNEEWYETDLFLVAMVTCVLASFFYLRINQVVRLICVLCILHKAKEIYDAAEHDKVQILTKIMPAQCDRSRFSWWKKFKSFVTSQDIPSECLRWEKELNRNSHHHANLLKVIPALISDFFVELLNPLGDLIGRIYQGLQASLPWYLVPFFLTVVIVVSVAAPTFVAARMFHSWRMRVAMTPETANDRSCYSCSNDTHQQAQMVTAQSCERHRRRKRFLYFH